MFFALMDDIKNARGAAAPLAPPPNTSMKAGAIREVLQGAFQGAMHGQWTNT